MSLIIMEEEDDKYSTLKMLEKRQIGKQFLKLDTLRSKYYRHMKMSWIGEEKHGGIFNMEFSPNGKVLMVACERCAILTYDPLSRKCIQRLPTAHTDCVNCICFFNEHIFASGSDDCTIALWDTRMLREKVKQLSGHTSWVKSLVYVASTEMLLSSAFDGTVRMWDIDGSSTAENDVSVTIFKAKDVSRMDLTPEGDKMIISCLTDLSYDKVIIFHNLDLSNFASDVADKNFGDIPEEALEDGVAKRNMPELLVADLEYPKHPLRIPSIQVHPEGSCLLSRYLSVNTDEYTTVHDIQRYAETSEVKTRLSHYILESTSGEGVMKEQSFSCDGRVIASPFAYGTRILAFDPGCSQWWIDNDEAKTLSEIKLLLGHHQMPVCCSKFSPNHMLLATGCLGGKIAFHEPKL